MVVNRGTLCFRWYNYVTVVEALFAALEAKEQTGEYQGIQTPCPTRKFLHAGYADDTLVGIWCMEDTQGDYRNDPEAV